MDAYEDTDIEDAELDDSEVDEESPEESPEGLSTAEKAAIALLLLRQRKPTGLVKPRAADVQRAAVAATESARRALNRTLDQTAKHPALVLWERETASIAAQLRKGTRGKTTQTLDPQMQRAIAAAAHVRIHKLAVDVARVIEAGSSGALVAGVDASSVFLHKVLGRATAIDDPVAAGKIIRQQIETTQAERLLAARNLAKDMAQQVVREIIVQHHVQATIGETLEKVDEVLARQWWRVERVLVTETSRAFNHGQNAALELAAKDVPGLHRRWTEKVSDVTGRPLDNRVGADSIALHGQIAIGQKLFSMPENAPTRIRGSWPYPPNRPNDRAIITPWMREWGLAGWVCQGGQRIPL